VGGDDVLLKSKILPERDVGSDQTASSKYHSYVGLGWKSDTACMPRTQLHSKDVLRHRMKLFITPSPDPFDPACR
jgi:hypothetical protein